MRICRKWKGVPWHIAVGFSAVSRLRLFGRRERQSVPVYKVDPFWPKPLPNHWSFQQFVDIYVTHEDHIWAINRYVDARPDDLGASLQPAQGLCCVKGPEILEFDKDGSVLRSWGGDNYAPGWPQRLQTMTVDREENVWLSGTQPGDSIIKFSKDGKFLWDFGHRGPKGPVTDRKQNNQQTDIFLWGIEAFDLDEDAQEIYLTDSAPNKRVLVYDMNTGAFKRGWGGKGTPLSEIDNDPPQPYDISGPPPDVKDFVGAMHCIHISSDGLVYVCERGSDRVQVFTKQGKYVTEIFVHPSTPARGKTCGGIWSMTLPMCGTVFNLTFSHDPEEKYLLTLDGTNDMVWIFDRKSGKEVGSFGGNGRYAGNLQWPDSLVAWISMGNVYTGEVEDGKRI